MFAQNFKQKNIKNKHTVTGKKNYAQKLMERRGAIIIHPLHLTANTFLHISEELDLTKSPPYRFLISRFQNENFKVSGKQQQKSNQFLLR